jgi:hypothetical protein
MTGISGEVLTGPDDFTEQDQIMIELASRGSSQKQIAEEMNISVRQVQRKLREPKVIEAIRAFCREIWKTRKRRLQGHFDDMETAFTDVMNDPEAGHFARVAAATQVKNMIFQIAEQDVTDELDDLRQKVAILEQRTRNGGMLNVTQPQE